MSQNNWDEIWNKAKEVGKAVGDVAGEVVDVSRQKIDELKKRVAPDGRKRQYYGITPKGREYLVRLTDTFGQFMQCIELILKSEGAKEAE